VSLTLTASLATAFAYGFGGVEALNGTFAVGTVVASDAYLGRLYGPLTQLSNLNIDYMSAMVSFERLFEVLDLEPMIKERPDAIDIPDGPAAPSIFEHVDFSYPGASEVSLASLEAVARLDDTPRTEVLHDITFDFEPGTMTALVGPSGAGKTTISMLVSRLYDVERGAVTINGDRYPRRHDGLAQRDDRRRDPGPLSLPRHAAREPHVRQARRDRGPRSNRPFEPRRSGR
jgi:ATP-binding cassette, subfamily B, bacterial